MHNLSSLGICLLLLLCSILSEAQENKFEINFGAGINYNTVKENGPIELYSDPVGKIAPASEIGFSYSPKTLKSILTFETGLSYLQKNTDSKISNFFCSFRQSMLCINIGGKIKYPKGKVQPYLGLGLSYGHLLNTIINPNAYNIIFSDENMIPFFPNPVNSEYGWYTKTGIDIPIKQHAFYLDLGYHHTRIIVTRPNAYMNAYLNQSITTQLGFRLNLSRHETINS